MGVHSTVDLRNQIGLITKACWKEKKTKSLGNLLSKDIKDYVQNDIISLLRVMEDQFRRWSKLKLSWQRIVVIKMGIMPRLMFYFLHLVVFVPQCFFLKKAQSLINKFVWGFKKARIKAEILQQKVINGGLKVPSV